MHGEEQDEGYPKESQQAPEPESRPSSREEQNSSIKSNQFDTSNSNSSSFGNGNADMNQMMQLMQNNMGFNPMMMMGMNPMQMFGSGMNGMNGMNMGMNFSPNMFGAGFQNNMWQNSNPNAFQQNGMAADFNYGFNLNQQQSYANGDYQSGYYGRGRGRGRGRGYGRGRGNYQNRDSFNNFQNSYDQQHNDQENRFRPNNNSLRHSRQEPVPEPPKQEELQIDDDEFAPGGQEEVLEALGEDYVKKEAVAANMDTPTTPVGANGNVSEDTIDDSKAHEKTGDEPQQNGVDEIPEPRAFVDSPEPQPQPPKEARKQIAEAYEEDLDVAMPPPSAPSGPAGRPGDRDFGFRSRGHNRFSRSRGSIHLTNGHPPSPVRVSSSNNIPRPESAGGSGVVGAPTGPRAMRDPPSRDPPLPPVRSRSSTSAGGGFQIMGRASMGSTRLNDRDPSPTPNGYDSYHNADRPSNRDSLRREDSQRGKYEDERASNDRDRRHHKSKREDHVDSEMRDADTPYSRSGSHDRSNHRSRRDRDSDAKHSSSSRRYHDSPRDGDYDMNDYGKAIDEDKPRSSRKSRDGKYSKDRDRERERGRDREAERERERETGREKDRNRDREMPRDKDRKRSRNDREYDDDDDYDYDRRHRSSKHHKKDHTKDLEINGRSSSRKENQMPTPVATPTSATKDAEKEKDPYTLEREARQRERMLKEDQRREKAANAKASGLGRRVSYKTEEDAQRGMEERESAIRAGRWR